MSSCRKNLGSQLAEVASKTVVLSRAAACGGFWPITLRLCNTSVCISTAVLSPFPVLWPARVCLDLERALAVLTSDTLPCAGISGYSQQSVSACAPFSPVTWKAPNPFFLLINKNQHCNPESIRSGSSRNNNLAPARPDLPLQQEQLMCYQNCKYLVAVIATLEELTHEGFIFLLSFSKAKRNENTSPSSSPYPSPLQKKKKKQTTRLEKKSPGQTKAGKKKTFCRTPKERGESQLKFSPYNLLNNTAQSSRKAVQPFLCWD